MHSKRDNVEFMIYFNADEDIEELIESSEYIPNSIGNIK